MTLKAKITDPEVVFVASLSRADAPALSASFQCKLCVSASGLEQVTEASIKDLRVLACPFLREKRGQTITTVSTALGPQLKNDRNSWVRESQSLSAVQDLSDYLVQPLVCRQRGQVLPVLPGELWLLGKQLGAASRLVLFSWSSVEF